MKKLTITLIACLFTISALASLEYGDYLKAGDEFYSEINGDGYEDGFVAEVSLIEKSNSNPELIILIPETDNYADCNKAGIVLKEKRSLGSSWNKFTYRVYIETSVEGDSGGCLVHIKDAEKQTLKIVNYNYTTGY
ncbi:MAG: hypothetical protein KAQ98_01030 [Bacteriovoracaceae bacterium]|nr:hypothetical protein [Bacteriovoracaceae bacterium]